MLKINAEKIVNIGVYIMHNYKYKRSSELIMRWNYRLWPQKYINDNNKYISHKCQRKNTLYNLMFAQAICFDK